VKFWRVVLPYLCAGFETDDHDRVVNPAPILRRAGRTLDEVRAWVMKRGGKLELGAEEPGGLLDKR